MDEDSGHGRRRDTRGRNSPRFFRAFSPLSVKIKNVSEFGSGRDYISVASFERRVMHKFRGLQRDQRSRLCDLPGHPKSNWRHL
jgi:hypothetical protein